MVNGRNPATNQDLPILSITFLILSSVNISDSSDSKVIARTLQFHSVAQRNRERRRFVRLLQRVLP